MSYCIDDPNPPYTGARGKGTVKFLVDIQENIPSREIPDKTHWKS